MAKENKNENEISLSEISGMGSEVSIKYIPILEKDIGIVTEVFGTTNRKEIGKKLLGLCQNLKEGKLKIVKA